MTPENRDSSRKVRHLSDWDVNKLFKITRMIHKDETIARILAELLMEPASAQDLCKRCDISPIKCLHILRNLNKNGIISIVKNVPSADGDDGTSFKYKSNLDPRFVIIEDGRIKVRFPGSLRTSMGKDRDIFKILNP